VIDSPAGWAVDRGARCPQKADIVEIDFAILEADARLSSRDPWSERHWSGAIH
jgi:hypothetical protein